MVPKIRSRVRNAQPVRQPMQVAHSHCWAKPLELHIEYVAPGDLSLPPRATRKHSQKQLAQIQASITKLGFLAPLVVDSNLRIVCGVARYLAATALDVARIPIIRVSHLTPDQLRAYALADNKLVELGQWDIPELAIELSELMLSDELEIELTGFTTVEIDAIVLGSTKAADVAETETIEGPGEAPAIARVGDVFAIGEHRLICGDARQATVYRLLLLGDELARCVFADFPYNLKIANNVSGLGRVKHGEFVMGSGEQSRAEFIQFKSDIMKQLVAFSMPGSIQYLAMDWRHQLEMIEAGEANYTELKNLLVWVKTNAGLGTFYRSQHEFIYAWKSGKAPHVNNFGLGETGRYRTNVLEYPGCNTFRKGRQEDLAAHSTVKPTPLVADLIRDVSKPGEIVLDPCVGSGTTILAAHRTGRRARCIELDPKYVDVAIRRCKAQLGIDAVHVETGLSLDELAAARSAEANLTEGGEA